MFNVKNDPFFSDILTILVEFRTIYGRVLEYYTSFAAVEARGMHSTTVHLEQPTVVDDA